MDIFLSSSIPDSNISNKSDGSILNKMESKNSVKYSDEKRFQKIMNHIKTNNNVYKIKKQNLKDQKNISQEDYHINSFSMVHFSKEFIII